MRLLFFDTELTALSGMIRELAWLEVSITDSGTQLVSAKHYQTNKAYQKGRRMPAAVEFALAANRCQAYVGHNVTYDLGVVEKELKRLKRKPLPRRVTVCTMRSRGVIEYCKIPRVGTHGEYKFPTLDELYATLFGREILGRSLLGKHTALVDVMATFECFVALQKMGVLDVPLPGSVRGHRVSDG